MSAKFFCNICGKQRLVSFIGAAMVCDECAPKLKKELSCSGKTGTTEAVLMAVKMRDEIVKRNSNVI